MFKLNEVPPYMEIFSNKMYFKRGLCSVLDDDRVARLGSFYAQKKIIKDMLQDITKNAHVLQIGLTFGDEISAVYKKVHKHGKFDIFDLSDVQIERAKERYENYNINIMNYNAVLPWDEKYDVIICYNLLHELPLVTRRKVMDNALNGLTNGGKAIFVDFAEPEFFNPLKWPLFLYNRLYRPFSESLWNEPLENFCSLKDEFRWNHTYYHWNMFQKVIATRKILSSDDVKKLTKLFREK
ncbi:MAG: class I SAM-dependent methyltransferase [Alphaproteobacteria bacterium]|nr:class I SAM-dependent methyltransferase [Alphaproteobacteria bacterium]